jgi:hypothetical protein
LVSIACMLVAAASLSLSSARAKKQPSKLMLSVVVRTVKTSYSIKENINLEIQLENVGTEPLLLYRNLGWGVGRTDVRVLDSDGKDVNTTFLADEIPPPPRDKDFIELRPSEFFGIRLSESAAHFVNVPGTYNFFVDYTSFVSEEWVHKYVKLPPRPVWSRERGTITSNKLKIGITE